MISPGRTPEPAPIIPGGFFIFGPMVVRTTVAADAADLINLNEAKEYLRVSGSDEDSLITDLVQVAVDQVEAMANTSYKAVVAYGYLEHFQNCRFPVGPVTEVSEVHYKPSGSETYSLLSTNFYYVSTEGSAARIAFHEYPSLEEDAYERIRITFSYGYDGTTHLRPTQLRQAALLYLTHLYDNRTAVSFTGRPQVVPMGVDALVSTFRHL